MEVICGWHIANSILNKSFEEKIPLTPIKLNCLVYLITSEYIYLNGENLITETFEKTALGPVIPTIYSKFDMFENKPIKNYASDAKGKVKGVNGSKFIDSLSRVWENFKGMSQEELLTYVENGYGYFGREAGEPITAADMLMDQIIRKEDEVEKAKEYIKKITQENHNN